MANNRKSTKGRKIQQVPLKEVIRDTNGKMITVLSGKTRPIRHVR